MSSTELKPIILYDIPCIIPGRPWSPNTMKTRYCLGYKGLLFTTVWIEFPDIARLIDSKKGITTSPSPPSPPKYTLPAIEDPNTGAFVVDSLVIAEYLDERYPQTPHVMSPAVRHALENLTDMLSFGSGGGAMHDATQIAPRLVFLILAGERLNPVSRAYYHQTRAARLGKLWTTTVEDVSVGMEARAERVCQGIEAMKGTWRRLTALYDDDDRQGDAEGEDLVPTRRSALGENPCFLDFAVAGRIKFVMDGLTPTEVESLTILEGDRLLRLVESLEKYYKC